MVIAATVVLWVIAADSMRHCAWPQATNNPTCAGKDAAETPNVVSEQLGNSASATNAPARRRLGAQFVLFGAI